MFRVYQDFLNFFFFRLLSNLNNKTQIFFILILHDIQFIDNDREM